MNQSANNGPCAGSLHRALPDRTASYSAQEDPGAHAASCSGSCSAACAERCTCSHLQTKLQKQSHCIQSHCALHLPAVQRIPQPRHVTRFDGLQLLHRALPEPRLRQIARLQLLAGLLSFQSAFYVLHNFVLNLGPIQLPPP